MIPLVRKRRAFMMPMTGPKLSSTMTDMVWSTLTSTCGAMYGVPGCVRHLALPTFTVRMFRVPCL